MPRSLTLLFILCVGLPLAWTAWYLGARQTANYVKLQKMRNESAQAHNEAHLRSLRFHYTLEKMPPESLRLIATKS